MNPIVEYKVSTHPSKFFGYQSKKDNIGKLVIYISTILNSLDKTNIDSNDVDECGKSVFDKFVDELITIMLVERCCLERAFQKIRMKNRCKPSIFILDSEKILFGCRVGFVGFCLHMGLGSNYMWEMLCNTKFHEFNMK